jgi:hypothetical protein
MSKSEKTKPTIKNLWLFVPLIIICAIVAGIFGETISRSYFLTGNNFSTNSSEVNLSGLNAGSSGLIIRDAKKVVVNQDQKISETINNIRPVLVGVFDKKSTTSEKTTAKIVVEKYYNLMNPLFIGLIITSDGWVVAPIASTSKADLATDKYVVIDSNRKLYQIDKTSESKDGNLLFFHLAAAQNLPVKKNVPKTDFSLGQSLLLVNSFSLVQPTTLVSLSESGEVLSSEDSGLNLSLALNGVDTKNSFVFNLAGDLAAIISRNQKVVPAFSYNYYWRNFLEKKSVGPAFLGLNYLDLSFIKLVSSSSEMAKGALVFSDENGLAILKSSPAEKAGLKEADLITWVNNQELDANNGLAEIISTYQPQDKITLTFVRQGVETETEVILGELK